MMHFLQGLFTLPEEMKEEAASLERLRAAGCRQFYFKYC